MRNVRPLVIGHLERVSVKAIELYPVQVTQLLGGQHGIYALYKNDRLYYVGLAMDLRRRIKQHVDDKHTGKWNRFSLFRVRKLEHIREIESLVLRIATPQGNRTGGRLKGSVDLHAQLRRSLEEENRREIDAIMPRRLHRSRSEPARRARRARGTHGASKYESRRPLHGLVANKRISTTYKGKKYTAVVHRNGTVRFDGATYATPSGAAVAVTGKPTNGWDFWRIRRNGAWVRLKEIRQASGKP